MPDVFNIGDILFQSLFLHVVFTFCIAAGVETAPGFLVPLHHEVSAVRTDLLSRLICAYEIAFWIVGASVEFTPFSAMLFTSYNLTVATWTRTFTERYRLCILALRETRAGQEMAETAKFLDHRSAALGTFIFCQLIHAAPLGLKVCHDVIHLFLERLVELAYHLAPVVL